MARRKIGTATSTKMAKTVVVTVHTYKQHPKYLKRYRTTKKFYAHDEDGKAQEGDLVTIEETRPLSKLKRWRVVEVQKGVKEITTEDIAAELGDPDVPEAEEQVTSEA